MAAEDWFDEYGWDGHDEPDPDRVVTCKRCGKKNLQWYDSGVRWILIEQTSKLKPHVCTTRINDGGFEDETR